MGWFEKKKNDDVKSVETDFENEYTEEISDEEMLELLNAPDENEGKALDDEKMFDEVSLADADDFSEDDEYEYDDEEDGDEISSDATLDVTTVIKNYDELIKFVNSKPVGYIQYMRKDTKEVFQIRELHLRIARVWSSVSINRQYSDKDYAKIMLALGVLNEPDAYYVLPMFTDSEMQAAIMTFCLENFGLNGKRYVKKIEKFAKMINENGMADEWSEYTSELIRLKLERFCDKHEITFEDAEVDDE